ncbi:hypothetical protein FNH05_12280, partial [Amycolatopsis rhizosphaerae]
MAWLDTFGCSSCGLPVLFHGDPRHPGHVVIDHVAGASAETCSEGLPDLRVLHRFCRRRVRAGRDGCSMVLRRAWLGWATVAFEAGRDEERYGTRHYLRFGLHPGRLSRPEEFRRHWRIRKMCCATRACRYYTRARAAHPLPGVTTAEDTCS